LHRIQTENVFVTRIKTNTLYKSDLPDKKDQDISKDEIIILSSNKAIEIGINDYKLVFLFMSRVFLQHQLVSKTIPGLEPIW
jgi:hypothetical protein